MGQKKYVSLQSEFRIHPTDNVHVGYPEIFDTESCGVFKTVLWVESHIRYIKVVLFVCIDNQCVD